MKLLSQLTLEELAGKRCLVRTNLDINEPKKDSLRVMAAVPTLRFLLEKGAQPLILSHRGRPKPEDGRQHNQKTEFSLEPLVKILSDAVGQRLDWLENLRFDSREQVNDKGFARELAARGDLYVNDDFAVSHRAHASVAAITSFLPSFAGLLLEKETAALSRVMRTPVQPLVMVIGGIKIEDKIGMIDYFRDRARAILMGSAYIGLRRASLASANVVMPSDWIEENGRKLDIGPKTIAAFSHIIAGAKTIIWNGPLGRCEEARFRTGSENIARAIVTSGAFSAAGGGDTDVLLQELGLTDKFSFVSTGGGAMLQFLSGKHLPALEALGYYG